MLFQIHNRVKLPNANILADDPTPGKRRNKRKCAVASNQMTTAHLAGVNLLNHFESCLQAADIDARSRLKAGLKTLNQLTRWQSRKV
jgi:hypothetical protein